MSVEIGDAVRFKAPVIEGEIIDTVYDKEKKELRHLVEWAENEDTHSRWFLESELEAV